jgi:hypothetical protein
VEATAGDLAHRLASKGAHELSLGLVGLVAMAEAALATVAPGVELTSPRHSGGVEAATLDGGDTLAGELLHLGREADSTRRHEAELAADRITPLPDITLGGEADGVGTTAGDLHDLLALQRVDNGRRGGLLGILSVAELAIHTLAPGEDFATVGQGGSVVLATRDLGDLPSEGLHKARLAEAVALALPVAMAELAITTITPGVHFASGSQSGRVVLATGNLHDLLPDQCLDEVRHARAAPVPMAELAITTAPPRVNLASLGENNSVKAAAGNLCDTL